MRYGERGLAHRPVTVWVYEGTLKLEYQAVTLSKYRVELHDDRKHIKDVSHPLANGCGGIEWLPFKVGQERQFGKRLGLRLGYQRIGGIEPGRPLLAENIRTPRDETRSMC